MGIENGGHWGQSLARCLSSEPRGLEAIGQSHHNGPKLVFDVLLEGDKMDMDTRTIPRPRPCPKPQPDPRQILKLGKRLREMKERGGELSKEKGE